MSSKNERFSPRVKTALCLAELETRYFHQHVLRVPHILLGLFDEKDGIAGQALRQLGFERDSLIELIKSYESDPFGVSKPIELAPETKKALEWAADEGHRWKLGYLGTGHILIGIILELKHFLPDISDRLPVSQQDMIHQIRQAMIDSIDPQERPKSLQNNISNQPSNESTLWHRSLKKLLAIISIPDPKRYPYGPEQVKSEAIEADYLTAITNIISGLLASQPDNTGLYAYRASIYSQKEDYQTSAADYKEAIRLEPTNSSTYCNLGVVLMAMKDYDGAIAAFSEMIRLAPEDYSGYLKRGDAYLESGNLEKALAEFSQAAQVKPGESAIYAIRAGAYLSNNEHERAIAECNEALTLNSNEFRAYHVRGTARADNKDYLGAQADFEAMAQLWPDYSWSHSNLAWLQLLQGNYEATIAECNVAIGLEPKNGAAYYTRGTALIAKGNSEGAVNDYRLALKYWTQPKVKHSLPYIEEMQSYINQWEKGQNG